MTTSQQRAKTHVVISDTIHSRRKNKDPQAGGALWKPSALLCLEYREALLVTQLTHHEPRAGPQAGETGDSHGPTARMQAQTYRERTQLL